jgi:vacuolar-type H+-ATPase subunit H
MDLDWIIRELLQERDRVDRLIQALEEPRRGRGSAAAPKTRRGRKSMDGAARKEVSERMKQYWAKRREQQTEEASSNVA